MNNFDRVILLGTSHGMPRFNSLESVILEKYKIKFSNYSVYSIGIDSYFTRLHGAINKHFAERCLYLCEMPSHGRYQYFLHDESIKYKPWHMIDGLQGDFWPEFQEEIATSLGSWADYIYHAGPLKMALDSTKKSLAKIHLECDIDMEREDIVSKMITLDGFIKSKKQSILWFSVDNPIIYNKRAKKEFKKHSFRIITNKTLKDLANNLYGYENLYEAREDKTIYPDGHHFSREISREINKKYIMPYLDRII